MRNPPSCKGLCWCKDGSSSSHTCLSPWQEEGFGITVFCSPRVTCRTGSVFLFLFLAKLQAPVVMTALIPSQAGVLPGSRTQTAVAAPPSSFLTSWLSVGNALDPSLSICHVGILVSASQSYGGVCSHNAGKHFTGCWARSERETQRVSSSSS